MRDLKISILLIATALAVFSCGTDRSTKDAAHWDVRDFGAIGDSSHINTAAIQAAIDACHDKGGGTVYLRQGTYLSGTLLLKDSVILHIGKDAKLVGSDNPLDYRSIDTFIDATGQERGNCLIGAIDASHIAIMGRGTIDGNGTAFLQEQLKAKKKALGLEDSLKGFGDNRPFLLRFVRSENIKIKNVRLRQPAAWTCHFYRSKNILVDSVSIYSHAHHNNDGIDLDSSSDAIISRCTIDTGDDAICFKTTSPQPTHAIRVADCTLKSEWGALKFGTESMGDFYDIEVSDCRIKDTQGGGIKILSVDGAHIYDIKLSDIQMDSVDMPLFIRLGERLRTYRDAEKQTVGSIDNIMIKNVNATTQRYAISRVSPPSGIFITGTPDHRIGKVSLENIQITLPGRGRESDIREVEEQRDKYPEFSFFKVLPAYGLYGRHIDTLFLSKVRYTIDSADAREAMLLEDVGKVSY